MSNGRIWMLSTIGLSLFVSAATGEETQLLEIENRTLRSQVESMQKEVAAANERAGAAEKRVAALEAVVAELRKRCGEPASPRITASQPGLGAEGICLGMEVSDLTPALFASFAQRKAARPYKKGVIVTSVTAHGPAHKSDVRVFDIITSVGGVQTPDANAFAVACARLKIGVAVRLLGLRVDRNSSQELAPWSLTTVDITPQSVSAVAEAAKGCPLKLLSAYIDRNSIGQPIAVLDVENVGTQPVIAYDVQILCFDRFGRPVKGYFDKPNVVAGLSQKTIRPRTRCSDSWTLHGHDKTGRVQIMLTEVKLADDTVWEADAKVQPTIGGELTEQK